MAAAILLGGLTAGCEQMDVYHPYDREGILPAETVKKVQEKIGTATRLCELQQLATRNPKELEIAQNKEERTDRERELVLGSALLGTDEIGRIRWEIVSMLQEAGCGVWDVTLQCVVAGAYPMAASITVKNEIGKDCAKEGNRQ